MQFNCELKILVFAALGETNNRRFSYRELLAHDDDDDIEMDVPDDDSPEATPPPPGQRLVCTLASNSVSVCSKASCSRSVPPSKQV